MKLKLKKIDEFKNTLKIIEPIVGEVNIETFQNGLWINTTNMANCTMIDYKLKAEAFDVYEYDKKGKYGVQLDMLNGFLKKAKKDDVLEIEGKEAELFLTLKGKYTKKCTLRVMEFDDRKKEIDKYKPTTEFSMPSKEFDEMIKDVCITEQSINFEAGEKMKLSAQNYKQNISVEFEVEFEKNEKETAMYSGEYLPLISAAYKVSPKLKIGYKKNSPLRAIFETENSKLSMVLAPRVENQ